MSSEKSPYREVGITAWDVAVSQPKRRVDKQYGKGIYTAGPSQKGRGHRWEPAKMIRIPGVTAYKACVRCGQYQFQAGQECHKRQPRKRA